MLKKHILIIALLYTIVLAVASFVNISEIPDFNYSNADKVYHFFAYSILSWLWFKVFYKKFKWHFNKALVYSIILSILFGILIEIFQGILSDTRVSDNNDILANVLGVSLTIIILLILRKTQNASVKK